MRVERETVQPRRGISMTGPTRSLAEIAPDEVVTVRRILFECLQEHCAELGVQEGDLVSVGEDGSPALVLRKRDGQVVRCPPELARFVEVEGDIGA
jgi:hypothetical protein